jgi:lipopolysaccharide/colanic/teichoic acid biosynthesis glycosyltransferase
MHAVTMRYLQALEQIAAIVLLVLVLPTLVLIALLLCATGGAPILVHDSSSVCGTGTVPYRFRTTGSGSVVFHVIGRWLRCGGIDELPSLWSAVRGDVPLRYFLRLRAGERHS